MVLFGKKNKNLKNELKAASDDLSEAEKQLEDEYNNLPVTGVKGYVDFVYTFFFCFFSGLACTGVLMYFTLSDSTPMELSYGVRAHCGGYGDAWEVPEEGEFAGLLTVLDTDDSNTTYYYWCYYEFTIKTLMDHFQLVTEIYLLSILIFVALIIEIKEFVSDKGYNLFNTATMVYYAVECFLFFWFILTFMSKLQYIHGLIGLSMEEGPEMYDLFRMDNQLVMNGTTNNFITFVMVARMVIGLACSALVWKYKTKNTTTYLPQKERARSCNKSCFFVVMIGLSSILAVIVLLAYDQRDTVPGEYIVTEQCTKKTKDKFFNHCAGWAIWNCGGKVGGEVVETVQDLGLDEEEYYGEEDLGQGSEEHLESNDQPGEGEYDHYYDPEEYQGRRLLEDEHEGDFEETVTTTQLPGCVIYGEECIPVEEACTKCGFPVATSESYPFFEEDEISCISEYFHGEMEDNVTSFVVAYSASYLFFLLLLHAERDRFQSTMSWYAYRGGFCIMLFVECFVFLGFYTAFNGMDDTTLYMSDPRPLDGAMWGTMLGVGVTRFGVLLALFVLEQIEVGCSFCNLCRRCCGSSSTSVSPVTGDSEKVFHDSEMVVKRNESVEV